MSKLLSLFLCAFFCSALNSTDYPLHKAVMGKIDIQKIKDLVAEGADPNEKDSSGKNVWQLIKDLNCTGQAKKGIRYAVNEGLREFFSNNPQSLRRLGDCGNPQCQVAETALYLTLPSRYKDREKTLIRAYDLLNEALKKRVCWNLNNHNVEGMALEKALRGYCCSNYESRNHEELHLKRLKLIQLFKKQLISLLDKYSTSYRKKKIRRRVREKSNNSEHENDQADLPIKSRKISEDDPTKDVDLFDIGTYFRVGVENFYLNKLNEEKV